MKQKIILSIAILSLLSLSVLVFAQGIPTQQPPQHLVNIQQYYEINNGYVENMDHVVVSLDKGWNLLPLKFIMETSGRYWSNYREGETSCEQDIFQNVWYYSPVARKYYPIPVIDDWGAPKTRENNFLLQEFRNKYYSIYAGSAWIYTPEACSLAGDSGTSLWSESYGDSEQEKSYRREELVMKAGWNFFAPDYGMYALQKNPWQLLESCGVEKAHGWHSDTQEWENIINEVRGAMSQGDYDAIQTTNIFETVLVKTSQDCNLLDFESQSGSQPPELP